MESIKKYLVEFIEDHGRPLIQEKVTEELKETKDDLKRELPSSVMGYITGEDGESGANPLITHILKKLGPAFEEKVKAITDATVDAASEGMDLLLTDNIINIAKDILTKEADEKDSGIGFNFDFLTKGKEGMVSSTMVLATPIIKNVSNTMGEKISGHFPAKVGGSIQQTIDERGHAGSSKFLGAAADFVTKFTGGDNKGEVVDSGGNREDIEEEGGHTGGIQKLFQKLLAPKILTFIQPYLLKFEEKMTSTLEHELRTKVFSFEYIKKTVISMVGGGSGSLGGIGGIFSYFGNDDENEKSKQTTQNNIQDTNVPPPNSTEKTGGMFGL